MPTETHCAERPPAAWPAFQNGGEVCLPGEKIAITWSPEENIAWEAKIAGYGQSSPIIRDGKVLVTSTSGDNKQKYHLAAFALTTGEKLWQQDFDNPTPQENTPYASRAAPTPVADAGGCIAYFEGGLVVAVDGEGKVRWKRDLIADYGPAAARHGLSSSLEQNEQHVFVWVERTEKPYLLALNKKTGETVWKSSGMGTTAWSSPRLAPTSAGDHLVLSASGKLAGFDPATGARLWQFDEISNNTSCTPIPVGEGKFLIGASNGRGEETSGQGAASNGLVQIRQQNDGRFTADFLWRAENASSSFGSPVAHGEQVFIVNRSGVLFTLDLASGKETSATRVASGSVWATPLVVGDHLYLFGNRGTTSVLSLASGKAVAENQTWKSDAPAAEGERPAFSGPVLYAAVAAPPYLVLRTGDALYAIEPKRE